MSPVFLSIRMTVATLALSENLDEARLAIANGIDRRLNANLTSFVGIFSVPGAFLVLKDFRVKFTYLDVTSLANGKLLLRLD